MNRCATVIGASGALFVGASVVADQGSYWSVSAWTPGGTPSNWLIPHDLIAGEGSYSLSLGEHGIATLRAGAGAERGGDGSECESLNVAFSVTANPMMPISFGISFLSAPFGPTGNTFGRLTGDLKVIDLDDSGLATIGGELSNGDSLGGFVNGDPNTGTLITSAFPTLEAVREMMATDSFDSGCITLSGIELIALQWKFALSAGDRAEGAALWEVCDNCGQVVPLPSAAGLGLVGFGLVASRRRRAN